MKHDLIDYLLRMNNSVFTLELLVWIALCWEIIRCYFTFRRFILHEEVDNETSDIYKDNKCRFG